MKIVYHPLSLIYRAIKATLSGDCLGLITTGVLLAPLDCVSGQGQSAPGSNDPRAETAYFSSFSIPRQRVEDYHTALSDEEKRQKEEIQKEVDKRVREDPASHLPAELARGVQLACVAKISEVYPVYDRILFGDESDRIKALRLVDRSMGEWWLSPPEEAGAELMRLLPPDTTLINAVTAARYRQNKKIALYFVAVINEYYQLAANGNAEEMLLAEKFFLRLNGGRQSGLKDNYLADLAKNNNSVSLLLRTLREKEPEQNPGSRK